MRKHIFLICLLAFIFPRDISAQSTNVSASVGKYYVAFSGYVSPFASVVMSQDSIFMASTVADPKGYFTLNNVFVNEGFTDFCMEAIDVKRVGDSYTCLKIDPVFEDTSKGEIFLPPTVGLSGQKINPGSSVFASGYSMPNAKVIINISKDIRIEVLGDQNGYYKYEIKDIPAGKYSLFATARYEEKDSEKPTRTKDLEALSLGGLLQQNLLLILLIVLLVIVGIILLLILLSKRLRDKLKSIILRKPMPKKKIAPPKHHSWFLGY
ncbi:MAG: carboxypeptidase regulatory-like domain-containing protein [Candidatus Levybacteria bacterium]|nr:carboxypeptidase regulatory-like domain-containing protein [Candidatus Levybacteria bacterium]